MSQKIWQRKFEAGLGLEKTLAATRSSGRPVAVESPPTNVDDLLKAEVGGDGFTLTSFTAQDAWELGHLLHARLLPFTPSRLLSSHQSRQRQRRVPERYGVRHRSRQFRVGGSQACDGAALRSQQLADGPQV
ncbi:hypothetical protein J3459_008376 [Metarhizium acridum]|nr:hypothetical protein J3459_008376 [Metarhizium acridum]